MRIALWLLVALSATAFVASVAVHASTYAGAAPDPYSPLNARLHDGIFILVFVVFASPLWTLRKLPKGEAGDRLIQNVPRPMLVLCGLLLAYAFVNFFVLDRLSYGSGVPAERNGELILHSHGVLLRKLSPEEYAQQQAYVVRRSSQGEMFFSFVALTILVAQLRATKPSAVVAGQPEPA